MIAACLSSSGSIALLENAGQQYAHRRNELSGALESRGIATAPVTGGLNVWIPPEQDAKEITYALALKGWLFGQIPHLTTKASHRRFGSPFHSCKTDKQNSFRQT